MDFGGFSRIFNILAIQSPLALALHPVSGPEGAVTCKGQLVPSTPLPYVRGADREELLAPSWNPSEKAKG